MKTFSNISLPSYGDMSTVGTPLRANIYDFLARTYAPDEARFWQPDPNAGNYPGISAYTVCAADPVNFVDPDGCDFWHTNDVTEITRFYNAILDGQTEFDFDNWNHFEDIEFLRNLVYDDRGHKLYATTTAVEDGGFTVTCTIYNLQIRRTPSVYSLVSIQVYEPVNGILDEISYFLNPWIYNDGLATWTVGRDGRVKGIVNQKIGFPPLFGKTKIKGFKIKDVGNLSRKE